MLTFVHSDPLGVSEAMGKEVNQQGHKWPLEGEFLQAFTSFFMN